MVRHLAPSIPCLGRMPVDQANENPCDLGIWQEDSTHARTTRRSAAVPYHRILREVVVRIRSVYPEHGDGAVGMDALAWKRHHGKSTGLHAPGRLSPSAPGSPRPAAPRAPSASRSNRRRRGIGRRLAAEADRKGGPRRPFVAAGNPVLSFVHATNHPPLPN
jgi:hypothetical protein